MPERPLQPRTVLVLALLAAGGAAGLRLVLGPGGFSLPDHEALDIRGVRVLSGATVGAALAVSGAVMQSLLRNPLASPDLMGVASGSGLAVMLAALGASWLGASFGVLAAPAALAGALLTLGVIYSLAARRGKLSIASLTLVGVAVGFMCGSAALLVQHLMADRGLSAQRWLMGSLSDDVPMRHVLAGLAVTAAGTAAAMGRARAMDLCTLGDEAAQTMGVRLGTHRAQLFAIAGVLAAASVYLAGPIGFVGLIAPHLVRLTAGPAHRVLIPAAALFGAAIILLADCLVRTLDLSTGRLPLGVVTSLLGGPVLIAMLRRRA